MRNLVLFLLVICTSLDLYALSDRGKDENSQKVELIIGEGQNSMVTDRPRTLTFIDACYSENIVKVYHDALGECKVLLLDSSGNVVMQSEFVSQSYSVESLMLPDESDVYTLIIDSEALDAYGYIVVE